MKQIWGARLRAASMVAACSLVLVACGDKDGDEGKAGEDPSVAASTSASAPTSGATTDATTDAPADAGTAEILDDGAGEQTQLALHLTEGQRSTSTMEMVMTMKAKGLPIPPIPMTMVMESEVLDVQDDSSTLRATYADVSVDDTGLPPELVTSLEEGLSALEGTAVTFEYGPTGEVLDTSVALPDDAPPAAAQMLDQLTNSLSGVGTTFPAEPVGIGASWRTTSTIDMSGISMTQVTTYVLEDLDGDDYRITMTGDATVEKPDDGAALPISGGSVSTTGEIEGSLGQVLPVHGTSHAISTTVVDVPGQKRMRMATTIDMTIDTETS